MATDDPFAQEVLIAALGDKPDLGVLARNLALGILPHTMLWFDSATERDSVLTGTYAPVEGMLCWLRDVNQVQVYNGSWGPIPTLLTSTTSGATAGTGFSLTSFGGYRRSDVITVHVVVSRTGIDIAANSSGNITDLALVTLPLGWRPPETMNAAVGDGFADGEAWIESTGVITLRSWSPNGVVTSGRQLHVTLTFVATS